MMTHLGERKSKLVDGEYVLTASDFRHIAGIMREDAGIALPEEKATLVYSRLVKRIRMLGLDSFEEYCALVTDRDASERREMLAALTTNVTRFFREPHHFEHLKTKVLPPLLELARRGGRVRLWSAACSSGQEPYSIGLTLLSLMPDAAQYDIRVLATDIDPNMIAQGRAGLYGKAAFEGISPDMRRWFVAIEQGRDSKWRAGPELRALVAFRELNLIGKWPMKRQFHAIFCRNAVIYFDEETQAMVWGRFAPMLETEGTLYIGHSERISGPVAGRLQPDGITTYRLVGNVI
jgi:chemotaxis protein methyltransferase CheR